MCHNSHLDHHDVPSSIYSIEASSGGGGGGGGGSGRRKRRRRRRRRVVKGSRGC